MISLLICQRISHSHKFRVGIILALHVSSFVYKQSIPDQWCWLIFLFLDFSLFISTVCWVFSPHIRLEVKTWRNKHDILLHLLSPLQTAVLSPHPVHVLQDPPPLDPRLPHPLHQHQELQQQANTTLLYWQEQRRVFKDQLTFPD